MKTFGHFIEDIQLTVNGLYPYIPVFILDYALDLTWRHIRIVLLFIECFKLHSIETT